MPNRFLFTTQNLSALPTPTSIANARAYYYDSKTRGFCVYVTMTGVKTYLLYRRIHKKPERIVLGRFDEITLKHARTKASTINAQVADGLTIQEIKCLPQPELTFGKLWEQYLDLHGKLHRSSWRNDDEIYRLYLEKWAGRKLSSIGTQQIRELHLYIGSEKGTVRANHVHALLRLMFNKAIEWGWNKPNPALAVKRFKETSRERFLNTQEMRAFLLALEQEPHEAIREYLYISLFTGARRSNVQAMRWQDIDLDAALWIIPHTKNGKSHIVPLVAPVVDILRRRKQLAKGQWVFESRKSKSGHLENPLPIWNGLLKRAGITNLRLHDLRRTLGSWQAMLGTNSYVIGKTLGHTSQYATAIYARLDVNPVRQSMNRTVEAMLTSHLA